MNTPHIVADAPAAAKLSTIARGLVWQAWNKDGVPVCGMRRPRGLKAATKAGLFYFTKARPVYTAAVTGETGRYMLTRKGLAIAHALDHVSMAA